MLIKRPTDIPPTEIAPKEPWLRRRDFIAGAGASLARAATGLLGAVLPRSAVAGAKIPSRVPSPFGTDEKPTSREAITSYKNFYELGTDKEDPARSAGSLKTRSWSVKVDGECESPGEIGIEDILAGFTQEDRIYRLRRVDAWAMVIPCVGVPLRGLLTRFKTTSRAKYVAFETLNDPQQLPGQRRGVLDRPYREGLRMDEATHPLTILATGLYGEVLPGQNGAPLRPVLPWKYGFKSIKSIGTPVAPGAPP